MRERKVGEAVISRAAGEGLGQDWIPWLHPGLLGGAVLGPAQTVGETGMVRTSGRARASRDQGISPRPQSGLPLQGIYLNLPSKPTKHAR